MLLACFSLRLFFFNKGNRRMRSAWYARNRMVRLSSNAFQSVSYIGNVLIVWHVCISNSGQASCLPPSVWIGLLSLLRNFEDYLKETTPQLVRNSSTSYWLSTIILERRKKISRFNLLTVTGPFACARLHAEGKNDPWGNVQQLPIKGYPLRLKGACHTPPQGNRVFNPINCPAIRDQKSEQRRATR